MSQKLLTAQPHGMLPPPRPPRRRGLPLGVYIAVVAVLLVAACGIISRVHAGHKLAAQTQKNSAVTVTVVKPTLASNTDEINLPGTIQAFVDAPIYARVSGYLKNWYTDIGAHVKKGQLMAEIETPEVDQQLQQAIANLATSKANLELADITNKRWQALVKTNAVSKQDADEKQGTLDAQRAQYAAADANVRQLRATQSFQKIYAPFDGVVTVRNTDIGQLINAGQGSGPQLFRVASVDKLRTFIPVPQSQSPYVQPGMTADLHFVERPGKSFTGTVTRTANSIDTTSRTLLTEVDIDNSKNELFPGAYVDVHIKLPSPATEGAVRIPANTLIFRAAGLQAAVVGQDGKIILKDVVIGRDFGNEVEIVKGLVADDQVVVNPPDSLSAGQQVQIAAPPTAGTDAAQDGHHSKPDGSKDNGDLGKKSDSKDKSDSKSGDSGNGAGSSGGTGGGTGGSGSTSQSNGGTGGGSTGTGGGGSAGGTGSASGGSNSDTGNSVDGVGGKGNLGSEDPASNGGSTGSPTGTGAQNGGNGKSSRDPSRKSNPGNNSK